MRRFIRTLIISTALIAGLAACSDTPKIHCENCPPERAYDGQMSVVLSDDLSAEAAPQAATTDKQDLTIWLEGRNDWKEGIGVINRSGFKHAVSVGVLSSSGNSYSGADIIVDEDGTPTGDQNKDVGAMATILPAGQYAIFIDGVVTQVRITVKPGFAPGRVSTTSVAKTP